jgi:hypothetical protein
MTAPYSVYPPGLTGRDIDTLEGTDDQYLRDLWVAQVWTKDIPEQVARAMAWEIPCSAELRDEWVRAFRAMLTGPHVSREMVVELASEGYWRGNGKPSSFEAWCNPGDPNVP